MEIQGPQSLTRLTEPTFPRFIFRAASAKRWLGIFSVLLLFGNPLAVRSQSIPGVGGIPTAPNLDGIASTLQTLSETINTTRVFQADWYRQSQGCLQGSTGCLPNIQAGVDAIPQ